VSGTGEVPEWLGKPLSAMSSDELEQMLAALDEGAPDDVALSDAVLRELARRAPEPAGDDAIEGVIHAPGRPD
jgi:hypothetical protein